MKKRRAETDPRVGQEPGIQGAAPDRGPIFQPGSGPNL